MGEADARRPAPGDSSLIREAGRPGVVCVVIAVSLCWVRLCPLPGHTSRKAAGTGRAQWSYDDTFGRCRDDTCLLATVTPATVGGAAVRLKAEHATVRAAEFDF